MMLRKGLHAIKASVNCQLCPSSHAYFAPRNGLFGVRLESVDKAYQDAVQTAGI